MISDQFVFGSQSKSEDSFAAVWSALDWSSPLWRCTDETFLKLMWRTFVCRCYCLKIKLSLQLGIFLTSKVWASCKGMICVCNHWTTVVVLFLLCRHLVGDDCCNTKHYTWNCNGLHSNSWFWCCISTMVVNCIAICVLSSAKSIVKFLGLQAYLFDVALAKAFHRCSSASNLSVWVQFEPISAFMPRRH